MGKFFDEIPQWLADWIPEQHCFWVATAPLSQEGHVNVSPKGVQGTFHIEDSRTVWYEDLTGSGVETISHLRENGRITIMFCAFDKPPRIARLFGTGRVHEYGTPEYEKHIGQNRNPGSRAVIVIDVHKVGTSCGYAIPFYQFISHRSLLNSTFARSEEVDAAEMKTLPPDEQPTRGIRSYWSTKNTKSIDGMAGLATAPLTRCPLTNVGFVPEQLPAGWPTETVKVEAARTGNITSNVSIKKLAQLSDLKSFASGVVFGVAAATGVFMLRTSLWRH
ncbi:hypothetical protein BKA62DRAFT_644575 [Auriculariales sp. MPI-PUGE-AT-0066]|nr:hypothetical protein BKA62DRAFT_644575 [Auriculariales sp. MPI-PUGE-AT-0066]